MSRFITDEIRLLNAVVATGVSTVMQDCKDFRHVMITIYGAAATATLKIRASTQDDVALASAASATNRWDYISFVNAQTGSAVAGDTGFAWTGTATSCEILEINVDALAKLTVEVTAYTAGAVSAWVRCFDNQ